MLEPGCKAPSRTPFPKHLPCTWRRTGLFPVARRWRNQVSGGFGLDFHQACFPHFPPITSAPTPTLQASGGDWGLSGGRGSRLWLLELGEEG